MKNQLVSGGLDTSFAHLPRTQVPGKNAQDYSTTGEKKEIT